MKTWDDADEEDEEDIEDDQDEEDDQNERKQKEQQHHRRKDDERCNGNYRRKRKGCISEYPGDKEYSRCRKDSSENTAGSDEITVESKDTHKKLGFRAYAKDGILYLTSNKKITKTRNVGKGTITVTLPADIELEEVELNLRREN